MKGGGGNGAGGSAEGGSLAKRSARDARREGAVSMPRGRRRERVVAHGDRGRGAVPVASLVQVMVKAPVAVERAHDGDGVGGVGEGVLRGGAYAGVVCTGARGSYGLGSCARITLLRWGWPGGGRGYAAFGGGDAAAAVVTKTSSRGTVRLSVRSHSVSLALVRSFAGVEGRGGADLTKVEA